jgi:Fe-S-cluster containining protein
VGVNAIEHLEDIYRRLPKIACAGKCQDSCGPIMMSPIEQRRVEKRTGRPWLTVDLEYLADMILLGKTDCMTCPLLDAASGRCSVYAIRPLICRLWGLVEKMRCPWGCIPERWVSDDEADSLIKEAEEIKPYV